MQHFLTDLNNTKFRCHLVDDALALILPLLLACYKLLLDCNLSTCLLLPCANMKYVLPSNVFVYILVSVSATL